MVDETARRIVFMQFLQQHFGGVAFVRAIGGDSPCGTLEVVDRDEGRLATHGQPHIFGLEIGIDLAPDRVDALPLRFGVGFGHARVFVHAHHGIAVLELDLTSRGHALDRCGVTEMRRRGERDMALGGE